MKMYLGLFFMLFFISLSCEGPFLNKGHYLYYNKGYNFNIGSSTADRGSLYLYSMEEEIYYALSNRYYCLDQDSIILSDFVTSKMKLFKKVNSNSVHFIRGNDSLIISFQYDRTSLNSYLGPLSCN